MRLRCKLMSVYLVAYSINKATFTSVNIYHYYFHQALLFPRELMRCSALALLQLLYTL